MVDHLSHLNDSIPIVGSEVFFTIGALCIYLNKLNNLCLFHLDFVIDVFSDVYFKFESFTMWLGPYKFGTEKMNFIESLYLFE